MTKAFRQVTDKPEEAEVITAEWAANTCSDYLTQIETYMRSCSLSDDAMERKKYFDSAMECLGHIVITSQMVGHLADTEVLCQEIFGLIPVEVVDWNPNE